MPPIELEARPVAASPATRYPVELIDVWHLTDGRRVLVRPVLPQDARLLDAFVRALAPRTRYLRFHGPVAALPEAALARLVEVDHRSHVALVASVFDGTVETGIAEARWVVDAATHPPGTAEFAIAVADAWQGRGIGRRLLGALGDAARAAGLRRLVGDVLPDNTAMRMLARSAGARVVPALDALPALRVELALDGAHRPPPR